MPSHFPNRAESRIILETILERKEEYYTMEGKALLRLIGDFRH